MLQKLQLIQTFTQDFRCFTVQPKHLHAEFNLKINLLPISLRIWGLQLNSYLYKGDPYLSIYLFIYGR